MGFKFLHCGDTHLGCTPNGYEQRFYDFFESFRELVRTAYEEGCKYLLISGDVFHLKVVNSKTMLNVTKVFEEAINYGLKIIVIEGNHDKAYYVDEYSWLEFLSERNYVTLLKHKKDGNNLIIDSDAIYEDENVRIIGIGYLGASTSDLIKDLDKKIEKSDKFTILMMHLAVNKLCGQDMGDVKEEELLPLKDKVDYIALGHIHDRYELDDFIYNPGSIENIRITDAKVGKTERQKGYYIVSVDGKEKEVKYHNSYRRPVKFVEMKFTVDEEYEEVMSKINNYDFDIEKGSILGITLYGQVKFNPYVIDINNIREEIIKKYDLLEVEIENLINISNDLTMNDDISDLKDIEKEAIEKYIEANYVDITGDDRSRVVEDIMFLKDSLIDNPKQIDQIIQSMLELEDGDK